MLYCIFCMLYPFISLQFILASGQLLYVPFHKKTQLKMFYLLPFAIFFNVRYLVCFPCLSSCILAEQHWLSSSSQNPSALESIQNLEASKSLPPKTEEEEAILTPPIFVEHVNNVSCSTGETAHFECKVEPKNDPSLDISKSP